MTAIGKGYVAVLLTNERGPVLTRRTRSREEAFKAAHYLLDRAEDQEWNRGETVSVGVAQAEE